MRGDNRVRKNKRDEIGGVIVENGEGKEKWERKDATRGEMWGKRGSLI